jgi:predicted RNA binding protein YcfA (HicA-like mRNA interferase family)
VLAGSKNVRFDEFITLLEAFGFTMERIKGSHRIFSHPEMSELFPVQPRKNGQAKPYQMHQLLRFVEQYELKLDEDET